MEIYTQKKLDELDKELDTYNWDNFIKEIKIMFSNKIKAADAEWRIKFFKQKKQNTADFMIEFKALAMKADTDKLHMIFLLKKNMQQDIIKIILGYLLIAIPETLKKWKITITSVRQEYKFTEEQNNYKISTKVTYRGQEQPMDIGKSNENFKDRKPKYFNYNKYRYMTKKMLVEEERKRNQKVL